MGNGLFKRCFLVLALLGTPTAAWSQSVAGTNKGIVPFLESTDVFLSNRSDLVFEAHLFPHLLVIENFTEAFELDQDQTQTVFYSISGTPAVRLRMFNAVSRPVRTPSYMPRGNVQIIWAPELVRKFNELTRRVAAMEGVAPGTPGGSEAARRRTAREFTEMVRLVELHATISHHSNGQDGCLYTDEQRGDDGECHTVSNVRREINKRDGSFSTNFVRFGGNMRWTRLNKNAFAVMDRTIRAELQWHPKAITSDRIEDQYGRLRFIAGATYAEPHLGWCSRSAGASVAVEYITVGRPEGVDPVAFTGMVSCHPTVNGGWGLFARFYSGQDYYNLGFLDNIRSLQAGFTYSSDGFFNFKR